MLFGLFFFGLLVGLWLMLMLDGDIVVVSDVMSFVGVMDLMDGL